MKIKSIMLHNIGPYINNSLFQFDVCDTEKNMVLIGGKNGAGKTTLFNAIKLCLYGCVAYGYQSNNAKYFAEVEKIINVNEKLKKTGEARVTMELLFDDGKYDNIYKFDRKWELMAGRLRESFDVYQNENRLSENEKSDFTSYLLQILPPNLFKFYFFDGEKISDFTFSGNTNFDFKDAFLKLCNLDTMEIIRENFRRISRGKTKEVGSISQEYDQCMNAYQALEQNVARAEEAYNRISNALIGIDEALASLDNKYAKSGGISKKEWRSMEEQIAKEELKREENRKWLKAFANNTLPFVILSDQLQTLKEQITLEQKAQMSTNAMQTIHTPEIKTAIENVLEKSGSHFAKELTEQIICAVSNSVSQHSHITPILNLSELDRFELTAKINSLLSFDIQRVKAVTDDIEASLHCVKQIRKKMEKSSTENYEAYLKEKSDLNETKSALTQNLLHTDRELQNWRQEQAAAATKLSKARAAYEELLKKQSINDISSRALLAFDALQKILYHKNIQLVETEFKDHFTALIHKSDLIDGIHIDENLNVLPYKNKIFYAEELKKTIEKNGPEYIIGQIGMFAYETLLEKLADHQLVFELPVEVKQPLSAGEKQVFIMALYQSLSKRNKIHVPYLIDTPFARIDQEHRENIVEQFFKQLKGQVIILSTDEELSANYADSLKGAVSDFYMLQHTAHGNTVVLPNTYFGGDVQ